jgi:hypothetical protein
MHLPAAVHAHHYVSKHSSDISNDTLLLQVYITCICSSGSSSAGACSRAMLHLMLVCSLITLLAISKVVCSYSS